MSDVGPVDTGALRKVAEAADRDNEGERWVLGIPGWDGNINTVFDFTAEEVPNGDSDCRHIATFDPPTILALLAEVDDLRATVARVEALAEPMGRYMPYAVQLDDDVIFAVGLDDLRAALAPPPDPEGPHAWVDLDVPYPTDETGATP